MAQADTFNGLYSEISASVKHASLGGYRFVASRKSGIIQRGRDKGVDVLLISRYPLNLRTVLSMIKGRTRAQKPQLAAWPFFCLDREAVRGTKQDYREARTDRLTDKNGEPLPWTAWLERACKLLRPRIYVILTYKGRNSAVTDAWPRSIPSVTSRFVYKVDEPRARAESTFTQDWDVVEEHLKQTFLLGYKRVAGTNKVNAFDVMQEAAKRRRSSSAAAAAAVPKQSSNPEHLAATFQHMNENKAIAKAESDSDDIDLCPSSDSRNPCPPSFEGDALAFWTA